MPKTAIKSAGVNDLARVIAITKSAYKAPYKKGGLITVSFESSDIKEKFLKKDFFVLTAIIDDKIVGAVRYKFDQDGNLYLYKLAVLKTYRRLGIGSLLINKLEKIARKKGCKKILLDCAKEKGLVEFYEKFGFQVDKVKKHQDHHDVFMSKAVL